MICDNCGDELPRRHGDHEGYVPMFGNGAFIGHSKVVIFGETAHRTIEGTAKYCEACVHEGGLMSKWDQLNRAGQRLVEGAMR